MGYPEFKNRLELREWLQFKPPEEAKDYCKHIFLKRKQEKRLVYAPSQVEVRTLNSLPSIKYIKNLFGSYAAFCESLGFISKYKESGLIRAESLIAGGEALIYQDTREKREWKLNNKIEVRALKFGDYTLSNKELSGNTYIERKSLSDFLGTISGGYDRFNREIARAVEHNATLIVLVEEDLSKSFEFNKLGYISKFTKVKPSFIFHRVRELIQGYPNIQFLFCGGRHEAARICKKILFNGAILKNYDLQLVHDDGIL